MDLNRLLNCAVDATKAAGGHALKHWSRRREVVQTFAHDVKLALDLESQEVAEKSIRKYFPHHHIMGEESAEANRRTDSPPPEFEWIIDPIDGTVNFSHGLPLWCCSIAVRHNGKIVAGAVYAPALNELYTAHDEGPTECNGTALHVSTVSTLEKALVVTGLDKNLDPRLPPFEIFREMSLHVQKARIMGVAALDICRVAAGQADGYFENGIYIWDIAAASLMVERAGGCTEIIADLGEGRLRVVASNGLLHNALRDMILRTIRRYTD